MAGRHALSPSRNSAFEWPSAEIDPTPVIATRLTADSEPVLSGSCAQETALFPAINFSTALTMLATVSNSGPLRSAS